MVTVGSAEILDLLPEPSDEAEASTQRPLAAHKLSQMTAHILSLNKQINTKAVFISINYMANQL